MSGNTCSTEETVAYWAAAARPTASNVSPVASDMRCKWKKLSLFEGFGFTLFPTALWIAVQGLTVTWPATLRLGTTAFSYTEAEV